MIHPLMPRPLPKHTKAMKTMLLTLLAIITASSGGAQVPLSLDTSFRATRFFNGELIDNLSFMDGSVIVTGYDVYIDNCCAGQWGPYRWLKLLPNGGIDETWPKGGAGGGRVNPFGPYYYVAGGLLPGRYFQNDGEFDHSYSVNSANHVHPDLLYGNSGGIFVQADGNVLFTGDHHIAEQWGANPPGYYSLLRLNPDATLDSTYAFRQTDGVIWTIQPTTQGRFLLSGVYNTYEGLPEGRILRIWPDGSLDSTFHTEIIKGYAIPLHEQPNGRIIAGGKFVFPDEPDTMHLIRLMPNGTLDTTFNNHGAYDRLPPTSFGAFGFGVGDVEPLADGTMIVAGNFTHIDGQLRRGVALLDSTGHLLNTALNGEGALLTHDFNSTYMYSRVNAIGQAPDGSIFLAGAFKGFDDGIVRDTSMTMIVKLHGLNVGIHEAERPAWQVRVWPNPGTDMLHIETDVMDKLDVRVLDATGRAILTGTSPDGTLEFSTLGLAPAIYLVEVNTSAGRRTVKWMKQ